MEGMSLDGESWASSKHARTAMRANRSRDTSPELIIRRALHYRGWRFRVAYPALSSDKRRTVDIAFTRLKIAILIDGCFWHGCDKHFTLPQANRNYWKEKIVRNMTRDIDTTQKLEASGWKVMRFWEHEDPLSVIATIENTLRSTIQGPEN